MGNVLLWLALSTKDRTQVVQRHKKWQHRGVRFVGNLITGHIRTGSQNQGKCQHQTITTHMLTIRRRFAEMHNFLVFAFISITGGLFRKSNSSGKIVCNH